MLRMKKHRNQYPCRCLANGRNVLWCCYGYRGGGETIEEPTCAEMAQHVLAAKNARRTWLGRAGSSDSDGINFVGVYIESS